MTQPVRLQLSRKKGFDLQALSAATNGLLAVNVARPSIWGNPFKVGTPSGYLFNDGGDPTPIIPALPLQQSIEFYRNTVSGFLKPEMHPWGHKWMSRFKRRVGGHPAEFACHVLRGKNLACWCAPSAPCHADVLLELANPTRVPAGEGRL